MPLTFFCCWFCTWEHKSALPYFSQAMHFKHLSTSQQIIQLQVYHSFPCFVWGFRIGHCALKYGIGIVAPISQKSFIQVFWLESFMNSAFSLPRIRREHECIKESILSIRWRPKDLTDWSSSYSKLRVLILAGKVAKQATQLYQHVGFLTAASITTAAPASFDSPRILCFPFTTGIQSFPAT